MLPLANETVHENEFARRPYDRFDGSFVPPKGSLPAERKSP
jgi:hypothetical protein